MDKIVISKMFNLIKTYHFVDTNVLKCILRLATPKSYVPDLDPLFVAFEQFCERAKFPKSGKTYKTKLQLKYDFNFIDIKVLDKLKFDDIDDGDLLSEI